MYGHPRVGPGTRVWQFISGTSENPMVDLPWKSMGVLELTALPSLDKDAWVPAVRETDCLLAAGGDVIYLRYWMEQSGLADLLPDLTDTVWVGLSAGSMVMAPQVGYDFVQWEPPTGRTDRPWALVTSRSAPDLVPDGGGQHDGRGRGVGRHDPRPRSTPWTTSPRSPSSTARSRSSRKASGGTSLSSGRPMVSAEATGPRLEPGGDEVVAPADLPDAKSRSTASYRPL